MQYDGNNAGVVIVELDGDGALVPFNDHDLWTPIAGKRAVSHFSVAGSVPDGGTMAALFGFGLLGLGFMARRKV